MGVEQGGSYFDEAGSYGGGAIAADMGADFNIGMGAGGDEYSPGVDLAPIDWGFDTTSWPTLSQGSDFVGGYLPGLDPSSGFVDLGDGYFYDVNTGGVLDTGLQLGPVGGEQTAGDTFASYLDFYTAMGYSSSEAVAMAQQATEALTGEIVESVGTETPLPDASLPTMPLTSFYNPWQSSPYVPSFPDLPAPLPPTVTPIIPFTVAPPPQVPMPTPTGSGPIPMAPGLPPACLSGQYHPYPIGHPQQNICVPFPVNQTPSPQQQQRQGQSGGGSSAPKPPGQQQQQCGQGRCKHPTTGQCISIPQGYYRDPATGQCKPIPQGQPQQCPTGYFRASNGQCLPIPPCTTPGTVFDAARGMCVPQGQAISPVPSGEFDELLSSLKELPWWVWLALGGLLLVSRDDDESGKRTTVTYKRA